MNRRRVATGTLAVAIAAAGVFFASRGGKEAPQVLEETVKPNQIQCASGHQLADDPIVFPNKPGDSHLHQFFGNKTTNAASTYETMIGKPTTCAPDEPKDTAGYWVPVLYVDGKAQPIKSGVIVYYTNPDNGRRGTQKKEFPIDQAFPPDFRMIAGSSGAKTPEENPLVTLDRLVWNCYPAQGDVVGDAPPTDCATRIERGAVRPGGEAGGRLDMYLTFPSCWVGGGVIDAPDHKSHVAYPTDAGCPTSHPVRLPQVKIQVRYAPWDGAAGFSSGAWWSVHADFWNTWNQPRLEEIVAGI